MEKLQEHERSIMYPKGSSRVMVSTNKSTDKNTKHRFNKVAENILTKIRYIIYFFIYFCY